MIHLVQERGKFRQRELLQGMFADRKRLFVDLFGWTLPVIDGQFEIDQFDTPDTTYLIATDDAGKHAASIRLMPTTRPHMLEAIFSHLCPCGVPSGAAIWESSRLCLPQRHGAERRRHLRNELISAMVDFALGHGIETLTGILPEAFRKEVLTMGWMSEPLGPIARDESGSIGAFAVHIRQDTPERLRWSRTYVPTVLVTEA